MFHCPECGAKSVRVQGTQVQGHCTNRWCICENCGARIRHVKTNGHGYWIRVVRAK